MLRDLDSDFRGQDLGLGLRLAFYFADVGCEARGVRLLGLVRHMY